MRNAAAGADLSSTGLPGTPRVWPPPKTLTPGGGAACDARTLPVESRRCPGLHSQAYRLSVTADRVLCESATDTGEFLARQTLSWLDSVRVGTVIEDEPALPVRGFMLDVSRSRVPTLDTWRDFIPRLARLKYNQLQLYTEHTFAYRGHEVVWRDASPYTPADIRELDDLCRAHHIELVPNQNSFGHFERWLKHPEYRHFAEAPDGFEVPWGGFRPIGSTLRPESASLALLEDLYDQLLPNFQSGWFNVGCDETFDLGQGATKARCEAEGRVRVYLDFLLQIHGLVADRGRRMMFWGDIVHEDPRLIAELPDDILALEWGYEATHPFEERCARYLEHGVPFLVCPGTSAWRSITGRTDNMLANIHRAISVGGAFGAGGMLLTEWGDLGHLQPWSAAWPALVHGACQAWNPNEDRTPDIGEGVDRVFASGAGGVEASGVGDWWLAAGRVMNGIPWEKTNSSPLFHMLLPTEHEWRPTVDDLTVVRNGIKSLVIARDTLRSPDEAVLDECDVALDMLRLALLEDRPQERVDAVLAAHERVWHRRFRPGGFSEGASLILASAQEENL